MAKSMPWLPANMTPERQRRVEAFSRFRRVSRAEAAAILIDAGIEAMRPVVAAELEQQSDAIKARLLGDGVIGHRPGCPCVSCAADRHVEKHA